MVLIRRINYILRAHGRKETHSDGVAIMLSNEAQKTLLGWEPVSPRIIMAKFKTSHKRIVVNIIQCYAPTNEAEEEAKEDFYQKLEETRRKCKEKDLTILMGDLNAEVGSDNTGFEQVMGKHGLGVMNENGELFANHCANNNLVIGGTLFPHKPCHRVIWVSPDMNTENQIDNFCISKRFRRSLQDVRVKRCADAGTDHHLLVANLKLKLKKHHNSTSIGKRYNVSLFTIKDKQADLQIELRNRFTALQEMEEEPRTIENHWQQVKEAFTGACEASVGPKKRKHQEWFSPDTLIRIEERKKLKDVLNNCKTRAAKKTAGETYSRADREVKRSARRDKRNFVAKLTAEAEEAARQNNIKALYDTIRLLTKKYQRGNHPVKDKGGRTLNTQEKLMKRWVEHFSHLLN